MTRRFYVRDDKGSVSGPHSSESLRQFARQGKLLPSWQVSPDRRRWVTAAKVQHLFPELENALANHIKANTEEQTRDLNRKEQIGLFIDQFVLNNEQLKDTPFGNWLPFVRIWWAKLTLPRTYLTAQVTPAGVRWVRHDLSSGEQTEIDQQEADRKLSKGVRQIDWFKFGAGLLGILWLAWSFKDFTFDWHPTVGTLKAGLMGGLAFAGFVYKLKRTRVFVGYVVDTAVRQRVESFKQAFLALRRCSRVWVYQVRYSEDQRSWKYNAGSLFTVARLPAALFNRPIPNVETNVTVPGIAYGSKALYLLPDKLLVVDGSRVRSVEYGDLVVATDHLEYVEPEGNVFTDSQVIDHRWKRINRDGSPDRRFKVNVELPVVRCGILRLDAGESELKLMTTDPKAPSTFKQQLDLATSPKCPPG